MIKAKLDTEGLERFKAGYKDAVHNAVAKVAITVYQRAMRKTIQLTGRMPGVKKGVAGHNVPSLPGEPPAHQRGGLRKGIVAIPIGDAKYQVLSSARYSAALEFGYEPNNLQPRPFVTPTMNSVENAKQAKKTFARVMKKGIKQAIKGALTKDDGFDSYFSGGAD